MDTTTLTPIISHLALAVLQLAAVVTFAVQPTLTPSPEALVELEHHTRHVRHHVTPTAARGSRR